MLEGRAIEANEYSAAPAERCLVRGDVSLGDDEVPLGAVETRRDVVHGKASKAVDLDRGDLLTLQSRQRAGIWRGPASLARKRAWTRPVSWIESLGHAQQRFLP